MTPRTALGPSAAPRIDLVDARSAPLLARPFFAAGDPGPLVASLFLGSVLGPSWISLRDKEIVILRTSAVMGCRYCTEAHTVVGLDAGLTLDEVRALRGELPLEDAFSDAGERALVNWCDAVAQGVEADIEQARPRLGGSDAQVVELTLLVATTVMLNRYATALGLPTSRDVRERLVREGL
jgi:AhpD family alkylhydroperoxidase